jgi:hypothetical protein
MNKSNELFETSNLISRPLPEQLEFEETLSVELPIFKSILEQSFELTRKEKSVKRPNFLDRNWSAVTMSGNIKGLLFDTYPGNMKLDSNNRFYFNKEGKYIIYFKKLNEKLMPSNIPTRYSYKLYGQLALQFEEPIPIVFVGYTLNESNDELSGSFAVCLKNNVRKWASDLSLSAINGSKLLLPINPTIPDDLSTLVKIKTKKSS